MEQIEKILKQKYPNEEVDILDFANQLHELNLIDKIDDVKVNNNQIKIEKLGFTWISPKVGQFFFNKLSYFVYSTLFIINIGLISKHPSLFPRYEDIFVFNSMSLNILLWMVVTFILVLVHEMGHVLAMRAYNLPTKLNIGHRFFLVVLETDMSSAWKLSANRRNVFYLAGIIFDTILMSISLVSQLFLPNSFGILSGIMSLAVLDLLMKMIYQLCVYMKTDLYYVYENITGCYNLMENAQETIKKWLPFKHAAHKNEVIFADEERTVFFYSIFYFVGVLLTLSLFVFFYIPQLWFAVNKSIPGLLKGPTSISFWDAVVFILQLLIGLYLLLYSWRKKYLQN
ncbi:hypothetical protein ABES02_12695 [Neobacillus pocheonensis]|uniref:hypothetical protein n=1 Tax=Neobacillus pocheonensis TaxID=363869 RepID=UPI003D2AB82B